MGIVSGFPRTARAADVAERHDLTGRRAIVTGANSGIGAETARVLASRGAEIVLAVRDSASGAAVCEMIKALGGRAYVSALDLADLNSVRAFAAKEGDRPLHLLINNAGIMACPLGRTAQGFELQLGVNHVGHFLLTSLLDEALRRGAPGRVVSLSSAAHWWSPVDFSDPNYERRPYDKWQAYGQSKTANILFARALDRRMAPFGVRAFSVMPGAIRTSLGRHLTEEDRARIGITAEGASSIFWKSVEQGAATTIWAALGGELNDVGGLYLEDIEEAPLADPAKPLRGVRPFAYDAANAEMLWDWSISEIARTSEEDS